MLTSPSSLAMRKAPSGVSRVASSRVCFVVRDSTASPRWRFHATRRWRFDFARGIQACLIVAPFAVWIIYGAHIELYATVGLLTFVGLRSALADRALKRAGIDKNNPDGVQPDAE